MITQSRFNYWLITHAYTSHHVHIQYCTCVHGAGKQYDSEGTEIPDICPDPEKSLNLQSTCSWDANMVSCTWGQEDMLCYYKAFFFFFPIMPRAALFICPHPPKKLSKDGFLSSSSPKKTKKKKQLHHFNFCFHSSIVSIVNWQPLPLH